MSFFLAMAVMSSPASAKSGMSGACATQAKTSVTEHAAAENSALQMKAFAAVRPSKGEAGAGDQFFDATFGAPGAADVKYHVIMWCKGMKTPSTMAIQPRY